MMDDRKTRIVIPVHPGKDIKPGLIRAIIKEEAMRLALSKRKAKEL
jgi:predicted RNA binding protein YcfA (HicA-like mRNA interferase family)